MDDITARQDSKTEALADGIAAGYQCILGEVRPVIREA